MRATHVGDERLRQLPEVFSTTEAATLFPDIDARMIRRWKERGLIRPAGPWSKLYYNCVQLADWHVALAIVVRRVFPSAVLIGPNVLRRAGWTTQIARDLHIAVVTARTYARLDNVQVHPRPRTWYEQNSPFATSMEGLPSVTAEQALWDCLEHRNELWCPDPDDLDRTECGEELYEAFCQRCAA